MGVRVGVDVGGTFTKAIAFDLAQTKVVAEAAVPTTHGDEHGVAQGVVQVVASIADDVGAPNIELVVHSTTQAVNALLEGDTEPVGVIGLGRRPELNRTRKRTELRNIELAPGKLLCTMPRFFDVTNGLDEEAIEKALVELKELGAGTVCVAEAFAPDDTANEERVAALAAKAGLPACMSTELSGLYGLELRAVTAAINASVLTIAAATAAYVEEGLASAGVHAPLLVMRGDGGATDMNGFRLHPARTLYSGPAATVAGALRFTEATEAVVVEIGGTSTNVAAIHDGQPALSYVRVASHATALRSIDVRVIGAAGGSMLRVRRGKVYGVGPRSAHIASLGYCSYAPTGTFTRDGCRVVEIAPRRGDPADYLAIETPDGARWALTNTCAAVALGITRPNDYAHAGPGEANAAFALAGRHLRIDGRKVASRMLEASGEAICELIASVAAEVHLAFPPPVVAVGGGAGGLGRHVAAMLQTSCVVPPRAEVISSIGAGLSIVRAERERTASATDASIIDQLAAEVEDEVATAGASPSSIEVRVDEQSEKGTVRAVATGAVALASGALPGREPIDGEQARRLVEQHGAMVASLARIASFWVATAPGGKAREAPRVVVLDRWGDPVIDTSGDVLHDAEKPSLEAAVARHTRQRGPVKIEPTVWVLKGNRVTAIESGDRASTAADLAQTSAVSVPPAENDHTFVVIIGSK